MNQINITNELEETLETFPEIKDFILSNQKFLEIDDIKYARRITANNYSIIFIINSQNPRDKVERKLINAIETFAKENQVPCYYGNEPLDIKAIYFNVKGMLKSLYQNFVYSDIYQSIYKNEPSADQDLIRALKEKEYNLSRLLNKDYFPEVSEIRTFLRETELYQKFLETKGQDKPELLDPNITYDELIKNIAFYPFHIARNPATLLFAFEPDKSLLALFVQLFNFQD